MISREAAFPRLLAALDPPPPVIWVKGDPAILAKPTVAIVGARIASAAGQRFARQLATDLGRAGEFPLVSRGENRILSLTAVQPSG